MFYLLVSIAVRACVWMFLLSMIKEIVNHNVTDVNLIAVAVCMSVAWTFANAIERRAEEPHQPQEGR